MANKIDIRVYNDGLFNSNAVEKVLSQVKDILTVDCIIVLILNPNDLKDARKVRHIYNRIHEEFTKESKSDLRPIIFTTILDCLNDKLDPREISQKFPFTSSLFNPNIWIRFYDWNELKTQANEINNELSLYKELYKNSSSREVFEHFIRSQLDNYLVSGDHSKHITPKLYSNELECRQDIINITTKTHPEISKYHLTGLRILLIDDKVDTTCTGEVNLIKTHCSECQKEDQKACYTCPKDISKVFRIAKLLEIPKSFGIKNEQFVWNTQTIKAYKYDNEHKDATIKWCKDKKNNEENGSYYTQIVQVTNIPDAIRLLSNEKIKFDLILMDYLLDKINDDPNNRELATNFFKWLKQEPPSIENEVLPAINPYFHDLRYIYDDLIEDDNSFRSDQIKKYVEDCPDCVNFIKKYITNPISNRGPLHKLWIFPISAYNQTLMDDLQNHSIRSIDYYWHIHKGADPVTTPYQFLKELNAFLYLQLEYAVFTLDDLFKFITIHLDSLKSLLGEKQEEEEKEKVIKFKDFQALMGAEYSVFVEFYFNRPVIYRDKDKSLFSNYIWKEFLSKKGNEALFDFTQAFQSYLNKGAFGSENDIPSVKNAIKKCNIILENEKWINEQSDTQKEVKKLLIHISQEINKIKI